MKKKNLTLLVAVTLSSSILFSSCIGSFSLTNKLLDWNKNIDTKFVNELVFVAFCIVPVYEVSALADILVLNSIEFWRGDNPVAATGTVKTIDTQNGTYTVETEKNGYHIQKQGDNNAIDLVYNKADESWNVETNGESTKLFKYMDNKNEVIMYLPDGKEMNVELSHTGVLAFRQVADNYSFYAAR